VTVNRRDAIRQLAIGGAVTAALPVWVENLLAVSEQHAQHQKTRGAAPAPWKPKVLDVKQNDTVTVLAELIIPETDTPGAKAARVNEYIDGVLADANAADRDSFLQGLTWLDLNSQQRYSAAFANATPEHQLAFLTDLSTASPSDPELRRGAEFFTAMRAMTIAGYYTSQAGLLQEIGDPEHLFFPEFPGCTHPEHQG
jgi:hypothetical protein